MQPCVFPQMLHMPWAHLWLLFPPLPSRPAKLSTASDQPANPQPSFPPTSSSQCDTGHMLGLPGLEKIKAGSKAQGQAWLLVTRSQKNSIKWNKKKKTLLPYRKEYVVSFSWLSLWILIYLSYLLASLSTCIDILLRCINMCVREKDIEITITNKHCYVTWHLKHS